jgi:hypothetical protein
MPWTSEHTDAQAEAALRCTRLIEQSFGRFKHAEFQAFKGTTIQLYSQRLSRVVMMYDPIAEEYRILLNPAINMENHDEILRMLPLLRGMMVLDDLASI